MKPGLAVLPICSALLLARCAGPAMSVRPLYLESDMHAADVGLEGTWLLEPTSLSTQRWQLTRNADGCYDAVLEEQESGKKHIDTYRVCPVRLQDKLFIDSELLIRDDGTSKLTVRDLVPGIVSGHIPGRIVIDQAIL